MTPNNAFHPTSLPLGGRDAAELGRWRRYAHTEMTDAPRNLIHLWDYGWLDRDEVAIPSCNTVSEVILAYVHSESFGTSFVGPLPTLCTTCTALSGAAQLLWTIFSRLVPVSLRETYGVIA